MIWDCNNLILWIIMVITKITIKIKVLNWEDSKPIVFYQIFFFSFSENSFTCIVANIHLQRRVEFFLLQVFIPSTMIVFISWVSFWLPINAVPARIALGSTTVLIMITQRQSTAISLPPVSYIKAIDVWTVTCLVFVFAALLEYAIVSTYSRHETKRLSIKLIQNNKTIKQTINVNRVRKYYLKIFILTTYCYIWLYFLMWKIYFCLLLQKYYKIEQNMN